ncbi:MULTISPECIES: DUF2188 domain-containing protein [Cupriavidus]
MTSPIVRVVPAVRTRGVAGFIQRWDVVAERATTHYPTQREAVAAGLKRAKQDGAIVFIYDASGKLCIYENFGDPAVTETLFHLEIRGDL